jgi:hypothetical protein
MYSLAEGQLEVICVVNVQSICGGGGGWRAVYRRAWKQCTFLETAVSAAVQAFVDTC